MPLYTFYTFNDVVSGVSVGNSETLPVPDRILAILLLTRHRIGRGAISLIAIEITLVLRPMLIISIVSLSHSQHHAFFPPSTLSQTHLGLWLIGAEMQPLALNLRRQLISSTGYNLSSGTNILVPARKVGLVVGCCCLVCCS